MSPEELAKHEFMAVCIHDPKNDTWEVKHYHYGKYLYTENLTANAYRYKYGEKNDK